MVKKNFDKSGIRQLLIAYVSNTIPYADYNELMDYVQKAKHDAELDAFMRQVWDAQPVTLPFSELESNALYKQILNDERFSAPVKKKKPVYKIWYGIAASLVLVTLAAALLFNDQHTFKNSSLFSKNEIKNDIMPGADKAILTLGDGSQIALAAIGNDSLMKRAGNIAKASDGQLVYGHSAKAGSQLAYNAVETPRGGQYQIVLPDGTKVWLNNASKLKFPESFTDQPKRMVELTGEAYFEVAHNKKQPFMVKTNQQDVEVLGTHFNVNSYPEENETRTTLLEGSVKVIKKQDKSGGNTLTLMPGQQAVLKGDLLSLTNVDLEAEMAWKNGYFKFNDEDLRSIMRKISRWYDVDVTYGQNIPDKRFEGSISRFKNVSEILRKFELTGGIHFKVEGRRITVMP